VADQIQAHSKSLSPNQDHSSKLKSKLAPYKPHSLGFVASLPIAEYMSIYSQLQTLVLENIETQYLEDFLYCLSVLPNLSSLTMHVGAGVNKNNIYDRLFRLPTLKYCELSFEEILSLLSLPTCTNPTSLIEHLVINDNYYLNEIDSLISYLPHLRRLSITSEYGYMLVSILLNDLTQLVFTLIRLESDDIDRFIKKRSHEIKILHFLTIGGRVYPYIETSKKVNFILFTSCESLSFE
jgi:hypothetical protein